MHFRLHAVAPLALVLAVVGALAGCGGTDDAPQGAADTTGSTASTKASPSADATSDEPGEPTSRSTAKPAAGKQFDGEGFSFNAPKGWTDATANARQLNKLVRVAAAGAPDDSGFATNVNVVIAEAGVEDPTDEQLEQVSGAIKKRLTSLVPRLEVNETTEVAGEPALDHEGAATKSGVNYYIHQFVAFHEGKAYTITFSFSRQQKPAGRDKVVDAVLASWDWS